MPPPRPCWFASLLTCREVGYLRRLVDSVSFEDWCCSCLCSELIPSVTERLALFVKELSFPQTTPTDGAFFNQTVLERIGSRWARLGLLLGWSASSDVALPCKNKKEKGSVGGSPVTTPMPKSVLA